MEPTPPNSTGPPDSTGPPNSTGPANSPRRLPPRHHWLFERREDRTLPSTVPIVASPRELASARPIVNDGAAGEVAPGTRSFFRLELTTEILLTATLHSPDASTRLTLLDGQGRALTRSEGCAPL
jgi:hypothetical protein